MPLQNRVTPFGDLIATSARGTLMGNRGVIHNDRREITRNWTTRRWICCVLAFKQRHREVMTPNRWTELFFLDEATALAAGHRPCFECRRSDATAFREAWLCGNPLTGVSHGGRIDALDVVLHAERTAPVESRPTRAVASLAPGTMFTLDTGDAAYLWWQGDAWLWSFEGYVVARIRGGAVRLLTPPSIECALIAGYVPAIHASANR